MHFVYYPKALLKMRALCSEGLNETQVCLLSVPLGTVALARTSVYVIHPHSPFINLIGLQENPVCGFQNTENERELLQGSYNTKTLSVTVGFLTKKIYR
jgi:hypothetical protein